MGLRGREEDQRCVNGRRSRVGNGQIERVVGMTTDRGRRIERIFQLAFADNGTN